MGNKKIWKNLISSYSFNIFAWAILTDFIWATNAIIKSIQKTTIQNSESYYAHYTVIFYTINLLLVLGIFLEKIFHISIKNNYILNNKIYKRIVIFLAFLNIQKTIIISPAVFYLLYMIIITR